MHIEISMYKSKISTKRWKVEKLHKTKNNRVGEYSKALLNSSIEGFQQQSKLCRGTGSCKQGREIHPIREEK